MLVKKRRENFLETYIIIVLTRDNQLFHQEKTNFIIPEEQQERSLELVLIYLRVVKKYQIKFIFAFSGVNF